VKLTRLHTMLGGIAIMIAGAGMFLDALGIIDFSIFDLWPVILIYFGLKFWSHGKRIPGGILTGLGTLFFLEVWFHLDFDDVAGLIFSIVLIYFGFRLLRSRGDRSPFHPLNRRSEHPAAETEPIILESPLSDPPHKEQQQSHYAKAHWTMKMPINSASNFGHVFKNSRSALIGDFHLTSGRFELTDMFIWHGIGNVVIDLSRAVLQEEEAVIVIRGWIGDITLYVPVDLPVAVAAEVSIGDLGVFGHHQGGLNRCVSMRSDTYDKASKKVTLNISLLLGDIDVKYI
jgi:lia operon protein LiaF